MILYIIRHGETEWNKLKRFQGQTDIPLAKKGIELARITGERMRGLPMDLAISSPLTRAVQTARLVMADREIPLILEERIKEISFGDWEGEYALHSERISKEYQALFYTDPLLCEKPPHGESFQDVLKRTGEFYQDLIKNESYQDKHILISTHGAAGRCFFSQFFADKTDIWRGGVPKNCAVCIVEIKDGISHVLEKDKLFYD